MPWLSGGYAPGAERPRERPPLGEAKPMLLGTVRETPMPLAERGGGMECCSMSARFLGFGRRGGTRRLKLATTSDGEERFKVGWAEGGGGERGE